MTAFTGSGSSPEKITTTDKLGGLIIKQFAHEDMDTPWFSRGRFDESYQALTMVEAYGSDMLKFSAGGYVWAAEATFNVLTPAANLVGSWYRGTIQYGQLPGGSTGGFTLRNLIEIAGEAQVMSPQFHLRTGVVNHDLVYASQKYHEGGLADNEFVGELINYVVLQDVAKNITTGEDAHYSL